ncbi:MAG: hypothetical protein E7007_00090 [Alphaproteobacteria bacterium]|nr:hypothetical protein [Alphaproteobacteria bacterium]
MKTRILVTLLVLIPGVSFAVARSDNARVGVQRVSMAGMRSPNVSANVSSLAGAKVNPTMTVKNASAVEEEVGGEEYVVEDVDEDVVTQASPVPNSANCRDAYRACMDEFCLLDESEGYRCACSSNINQSKELIQEIQKIQEEADKLYTEGVEREQLGAKARLVFGESEAAKKSSRASGLSFSEWLNGGSVDEESLDSDADIGDGLYAMAAEYCATELEACGDKAEMEEMLYSRQIVADCKSFSSYLAEQKSNAQSNKRTAEAAVRQARLAMLDTTNKYNRGECLLAYRSCIADKGGCGANFENCLDADLLGRRANACENVLDQCMAVKDYVLQDWEAESEAILVDAAKYADKYRRQTCLAQIQVCLEDGCSTATNSACLTDVNVAAGVCPIIDECDAMIPGLKAVVNDKLGYLRTQFCQNDVDACLRDKCGENFTAPECVGKKTSEIIAMCPQNAFPSCKNETQFDIIVSAAVLQMDYQMMQGCINHFGEQLGKVCGTDMSCLPSDDTVMGLTEIPADEASMVELRVRVRDNSKAAVNEFFKQFEKDMTISACADAKKPAGRRSLGDSVFNTAKLIAEIGAENRAMRELESKIAELSRQQDLEEAEKNCYATYKVETPDKSDKNYSYIRSVSFEPSLRNCHVCRMQRVCETGGETKGTGFAKGAAGGLSAGAAAGTMVTPGWGTAIGGVVGAVGGGLMGMMAAGEEEFCQEIESCEDVNM